MSSRYYPLYQRGNPQLRVFLPNFWMKLVKSEERLPPNVVLFRTSIEMTKYDVRNYLEKIYKVPVVDIKTTIKMGTIKKRADNKGLVKEDDYKEALVYLPKDYEFEFPDICKREPQEELERYKEMKKQFGEQAKKKRPGSLSWFTGGGIKVME